MALFFTRRVWFCLATSFLAGSIVRADSVDDLVGQRLKSWQVPGAAVAVIQGGRVVKSAGYGLANVEWNVPVTSQTVFQIQSVTKQFTATAIMMLVEEGKVSLDSKVSSYLEGTPESWKEITVRHLLNQTSGIKDFINQPTASLRLEVTEEEVLRATAERPLDFQPGERYAYSNTNYHLLAMIIRKVTGQAYGEFLKKRIFEPLSMTETRIVSWSEIIPNRAAGYVWDRGRLQNGHFVAESILAYGGGGIVSTAEDMAKWDLGLRNEKVLKRSLLDQMWAPARLNGGGVSNYGFGWGIGGKAGHRFVTHSGGHMTGFTSVIIRFLDDDLSVVVLFNRNNANPGKLGEEIAGWYVPALKPPERQPIEDKNPEVTAFLRKLVHMIQDEQLDESVFAPELYKIMAASVHEHAQQAAAAGTLNRVELLQKAEPAKDLKSYLYRLRFEHATFEAEVTLDKDGKVTGLNVEAQ